MAHDFKCEIKKEGVFFYILCKMTLKDKTYGLNLLITPQTQI
jgi:hypothetical protein